MSINYNFIDTKMFQLVRCAGKVAHDGPMFVVQNNKVVGTVSLVDLKSYTEDYNPLKMSRLSYSDIYENPEFWFLIDKANEYLHFSYKSKILHEVLCDDLLNYVTNF